MKISKEGFWKEFWSNQSTPKEINDNILEGMNVHGANFIILICAIIIASVGLNMNATAVIIGAMLISPLMGSIIGVGYGIGTYNVTLIKKAFKILSLSIVISLITSTIYFSITPLTVAGSEIISRTSPTIWDVIIAFTGGIAGMIGLTRKKASNVIPGVAIATALMPPLCTAGYGIANFNMDIAIGAGYLFFINCFFITISTFMVTKMLRLPNIEYLDHIYEKKIKRYIVITSIVVIIPSIFSAVNIIKETIYESNLNTFINSELKDQYVLDKKINMNDDTISLVIAGDLITKKEQDELNSKLGSYGLSDMKLSIKQEGDISLNVKQYIEDMKNSSNGFISDNSTYKDSDDATKPAISKIDPESIGKELKVLYPSIQSVSTGYIIDEDKSGYIPTLIIYSDDANLTRDIPKIKEWYKARTSSENVRVLIENK